MKRMIQEILKQQLNKIEPKVLERILFKAICSKTAHEPLKNLSCDKSSETSEGVGAVFDCKDHIVKRNNQT